VVAEQVSVGARQALTHLWRAAYMQEILEGYYDADMVAMQVRGRHVVRVFDSWCL
jgi:hypothetical protein